MAKPLLCESCHTVGKPKTNTPGSFALEVALWVLFCAPGLVYSLWRMSARKRVCARCGGESLLPPDSPRARAVLATYAPPPVS